ncbi:MAG: hypothetical protein H6560_15995 [Lewinellaceae bacterium]|nr:hypothetical protein [Lewinellaceae bacterium]
MKNKILISVLAFLPVLLLATVIIESCLPIPPSPPEQMNRKVIVTEVGEITQETRFEGERTKYRIYFFNELKKRADIRIEDKLDSGLSDISPLNEGAYSETGHVITWLIRGVEPKGNGFVEFEAVLGKADTIRNKASIEISEEQSPVESNPRKRPRRISLETNQVITVICGEPDLGWIPFEPSGEEREGEMPEASMKDETTTDIMVNFDIPGMFVYQAEEEGIIYHRVIIPGQANMMDVGKPELPVLGRMLEIPRDVSINVEIVKERSRILDCYNIYPAQEPGINQDESEDKPFTIDPATYQLNEFWPASLAVVEPEDIGIIRGHRVVFLKIRPVQFNPAMKKLKVFSNIEVRLRYNQPAQIQPIPRRIESRVFEEMLSASVLNYKGQTRFFRPDGPTGYDDDEDQPGCDYLILTHNRFYNAGDPNNPIVRFQNWKRQKGYETQVVDIANISNGTTAGGIRTYLQNAYDKWDPAPSYVLLVGDVGDNANTTLLPTNYGAYHSDHISQVGTDLFYSTLDGSDYFPDVFIGRLSVDDLAQATTVVNKILDYEQNPPAPPNFYTDAALIALFEDDQPDDRQEDRPWIENMEEIFAFLDANGYNPNRRYNTSGTQTPLWFENGGGLQPPALTALGWNDDDADISTDINNGRFLVTYRDHGSRSGWSGIFGFNNTDVNALANGNLTPVVLSIACENGWFDNESDAADVYSDPGIQATATNSECFAEQFLRNNSGGAVAFIGATRISWTGVNDFFMFGMHKAIWPAFNPAPPLTATYPAIPGREVSPMPRMGQVHNYGKIFMANAYGHSTERQITFEMYTLFGDPEMPIWTEEPVNLAVGHPKGIGSTGQQDFVVKAEEGPGGAPVANATVAITRDDEILAVKQTNPAGLARFMLAEVGSGDASITVTGINLRPYQGIIEINAGGAEINRLDQDNGVEGQSFKVGGHYFSGNETVDVFFNNQLKSSPAASGGNFGQIGNDLAVNVPSPHPLGPVNILAFGNTSERYAVDVFQVRAANPIDLYIYSQWDPSTHFLHTGDNPTWNNPEIQLYESGTPVESNNLEAGHTYTIEAKIYNDTDFDAEDVKVTFKWADFGIGHPDKVWNFIDTDEIDVGKHSNAKAEAEWSPTTGHLCIIAEIYHVEDINEANNRGQENCHIGPTSSPAIVPFTVWNPTEEPAYIFLELRQLSGFGEQEPQIWASRINHPDPQLILPGMRSTFEVLIDPDPARVSKGQQAEFALTGFIRGQMIGGTNFIIIKN